MSKLTILFLTFIIVSVSIFAGTNTYNKSFGKYRIEIYENDAHPIPAVIKYLNNKYGRSDNVNKTVVHANVRLYCNGEEIVNVHVCRYRCAWCGKDGVIVYATSTFSNGEKLSDIFDLHKCGNSTKTLKEYAQRAADIIEDYFTNGMTRTNASLAEVAMFALLWLAIVAAIVAAIVILPLAFI